MHMMVTIAAIVLAAVFPHATRADDGSWGTDFREAAGPIYAQTPNPDIALEAELLRFSMLPAGEGAPPGLTEAVFLFRNTTDRQLAVEAGFPIKVGISMSRKTDGRDRNGKPAELLYLAEDKYGRKPYGSDVLEAFYGDAVFFDKEFGGIDPWENKAWVLPAGSATLRKMANSKDFSDPFNFDITQDGQPVGWKVFLESKPAGGARLELGFHYRHSLSFKAKSSSVVKVSYIQSVLRGEDSNSAPRPSSHYGWDYVLGTGGTWKGGLIGKLLLCLPAGAKPSLPKAFAPLGLHGFEQVFLARDFKPAANDMAAVTFDIKAPFRPESLEQLWFGSPTSAPKPAKPAQDFVKLRKASSSLPDKTTVYTPQGLIKDMDFSPLRLFDGVLESAWVEGAKDDGIGEWVECELTRPAAGLRIQNGFSMSLTPIKGKDIDGYYAKNNRVKGLEITFPDGDSHTIELEDTNAYMQYIPGELTKGVYRFTIRSVYKGTKWSDTCLGEIEFVPASEALTKLLAEDEFLYSSFKDLHEK